MKYLKIISIFSAIALQSCFSADEDPVPAPPITGSVVTVELGKATEPNQVWIDLSDFEKPSVNKRTDWDLGFYTGDGFHVVINGSIAMTVAKIPNKTDIKAVTESDVTALKGLAMVGTFNAANLKYVDDPSGNFLTQTSGIEPIKENDAENPVYLVNLGRGLPSPDNIGPGSVNLAGAARGWKKMQIFRAANGYKIRYADVGNTTSYNEYLITKDPDYNFSFFSFDTGTSVKVQPKKKNWDLGFTTFTNEVFTDPGVSAGSYFFADFIVTNIQNGVGVYQVNTGTNLDQAYNAFTLNNVDQSKFIFNDQRALGDKWRTTTGTTDNPLAHVYADRFFVLKDTEGFYFKLRFNTMKDKDGNRGTTNFEFDPL